MFKIEKLKYKNILDIDELVIEEKKINVIVGASGTGKTTFLKLLNKLISPTEGKIYYRGLDLNDLDSIEHRKNISLLSQNPTIFHGNIRENLNIGLNFQKKSSVSDNVLTALLKDLKLNKNLDEDANNLSGGEKQRLALGRLLLLNPDIFLLDEPSSNLDKETENFIINLIIERVRNDKGSLIMITHSTNIAEKYAENIIDFAQINRASEVNL